MKLEIKFEDKDILIVEKPSGLVVNRSETTSGETLQDQLADYFQLGNSLGIGDRAGIVHRLDRETSGLLIVAKTNEAFKNLQNQFKNREVQKEYIALVHGHLKQKQGTVELPVSRIGKFGKFGVSQDDDGRESKTEYETQKEFYFDEEKFEQILAGSGQTKSRVNYLKKHATLYSLVNLYPRTGRTHQIRVHIKSLGHPVVSDLIYTPNKLLKFDLFWCPRLFLHAASVEFKHPGTRKIAKFTSILPNDLKDAILYLKEINTKP